MAACSCKWLRWGGYASRFEPSTVYLAAPLLRAALGVARQLGFLGLKMLYLLQSW